MNQEEFDKAYSLLNYVLKEQIWVLRGAVYCVGCPDAYSQDREKALKFANDYLDQTIDNLKEVKRRLNKNEES